MAKGTKHAKDWKPTTLDAIELARTLYVHSCHIMGNKKAFNPANDYNGETLSYIRSILLRAYTNLWAANKINVQKEPDRLSERLGKQRHAIGLLDEAIMLIDLVKSQFHLPTPKFWNWARMAEAALEKAEAWNKADAKRYVGNVLGEASAGPEYGSRLKSRRERSAAVG